VFHIYSRLFIAASPQIHTIDNMKNQNSVSVSMVIFLDDLKSYTFMKQLKIKKFKKHKTVKMLLAVREPNAILSIFVLLLMKAFAAYLSIFDSSVSCLKVSLLF
jgi:hypothetical protein